MKRCLALLAAAALWAPGASAVDRSLDQDWRFTRGDFAGAERAGFDDSAWRRLDVPHDWGIEGPFDPMNPAGGAGAFLPTGVGWYRKHFALPADAAGRKVYVAFEGVMMNSDVWVNGVHLGRRPYGYVSFRYEVPARALKAGGDNLLAVRVNDADQPASRWYAGAGIYRHVRLEILDPVHIFADGVFVTTPEIAADRATVHVETTVVNESDSDREVQVDSAVTKYHGPEEHLPPEDLEGEARSEPRRIPAHGAAVFDQDIAVAHPRLWNLDDPNLYTARASVESAGRPLDAQRADFGIRDAHFEAATGFWLNGRNFKVKGVCVHADGSAFGAAVPLDVWRRRLQILKDLGANAIRCAHNPPAPEFLELCDQMGFLVMDEMFDCWTVGKNIADYHLYFDQWSDADVRDTVRRDRNHPSIILYSVGNEIHDTPNADLSKRILARLIPIFHENDPTRPVTQALLRPNASHDYDDGLADMLDVIGTNYRDDELLAAHRANPARKIIGTENHHDRQAWLAVRDHAPYAGQFLWSGIDYLGESPRWPLVSSRSGLIDRVGTPHPLAYERQAWWSARPVVHIVRRTGASAPRVTDPGYQAPPANYRLRREVLFRDWTPQDLGPHQESVEVYSNCQQVELFLNGRSLGSQPLPADASPRVWKVDFAAGTIRAVASNGGREAATDELRTAGAPAKLVLRADGHRVENLNDHTRSVALDDTPDAVAAVEVDVVDAQGTLVPSGAQNLHFTLKGPGRLRLDSGDNSSHEDFFGSERRAYQGRCFAFVQWARGASVDSPLVLEVSAPGLAGASLSIGPGSHPL
ncbi:MAG TPA: glycoside hydrolase family 2 TIM barrel-domain containing protein [Opitutaceae bacterium]|nr:glycoside hydrolase family 2 TIM barrel-domain containing protein [Opitutaceae bacterium]